MMDIFDFWKDVGPACRIHPKDEGIISRYPKGEHALNLDCCPVPFYGPLRTAAIVLLYLNPGLSDSDTNDAKSAEGQKFWFDQRSGTALLRSQEILEKKSWWVSRTKRFGVDPEHLRSRMAVLEICPYHSKSFEDGPLLAALPSCRASIEWAQQTLFPSAIDGGRVVVCLRAASYWGLVPGNCYGESLFAPRTARSGHMMDDDIRETVIATVQRKLNS